MSIWGGRGEEAEPAGGGEGGDTGEEDEVPPNKVFVHCRLESSFVPQG